MSFYEPKSVKKWCEVNKEEMDLYGNLMKKCLIEISKLIQNQGHSGGSIHALRKNLLLMLLDNHETLKKIGFDRKIKTFKEIEEKAKKK